MQIVCLREVMRHELEVLEGNWDKEIKRDPAGAFERLHHLAHGIGCLDSALDFEVIHRTIGGLVKARPGLSASRN